MTPNLSAWIRDAAGHGAVAVMALAAVAVICLAPAAQAQTQSPLVAGATSPLPPSQERLFQQARSWVMNQQPTPTEPVQFAALDSRVQIADCSGPLQFDYPFSGSRETVRVRCPQPLPWQMFLRVTSRPAAVAAAPARGAVLPTAATTPVTIQPAQRTVVVTRQLIKRGAELTPDLIEEVQRPVAGLDPLAIHSLKDADRAEAIRDIPAGTVLRSYDIKRTLLVRKGQAALLTVGPGSGFQITVRVEAQQDGHLGEQIRLKNTESGRLISGVVTGPNALKGL
jgi:flagella basal body P-ring formation protein FlgA